MAEATPSDVRIEIDTDLSDLDISDIIDRVARDIDREYESGDFENTQHRRDFEAVLTALRIASGRDRRAINASSESAQIQFEVAEVKSLRRRVNRLDPADEFSVGGVRRDADRNVRSANNTADDDDAYAEDFDFDDGPN